MYVYSQDGYYVKCISPWPHRFAWDRPKQAQLCFLWGRKTVIKCLSNTKKQREAYVRSACWNSQYMKETKHKDLRVRNIKYISPHWFKGVIYFAKEKSCVSAVKHFSWYDQYLFNHLSWVPDIYANWGHPTGNVTCGMVTSTKHTRKLYMACMVCQLCLMICWRVTAYE